ncbi:ABC transporter substrate-binding protein [Nakamurella sp. YIM 132087]|uniref:ABC transporter substrate-binding protein n=1 Tax=Nakamurella alba TaxID=2665158 RepID=A0A7K1FI51_9ACTN|nr:ABC transporter substrate-binding protein [Nakamurella alba]MTD13807.1 ABC transporter substrate-binding protein [Nakamurella alba]
MILRRTTASTRSRTRVVLAALAGSALVLVSACSAGSSVTPSSSAAQTTTPSTAAPSSGGSGTESAPPSSDGSATGSSQAPVSDAALSIGFILEPTSLDFTTTDGAAIPQVLLTNVYETLVKLDQSGQIVPGLASAWEVSDDNKTYTFTLQDGVTFSDGSEFTAEDAKFSIDRVTSDWTVAIKAGMDVVDSTEVVSPTELKVTLKQPSNSWLFRMTGRIGAMFSEDGVADLANTAIGTGPYTLQTWNRGTSIVLERNPDYWGTAPSVKTVTFQYFKDADAMNSALLTGSIQVVSTLQSPETIDQFADTSKYKIIEGATDGEVMMTLNDGKAPLNDVKVRQAINYALDKQAILDGAWGGYGTVIGSHESPNDPWFVDLADKYPHDVEKAKALLAEAGQSDLTLNLALPPVPYAQAAAPIIVSQLAEAGITVNASNVTFPVWLDQVFGKADYDMTIINHVEPRDVTTIWGNPEYYTRYDNPEVQKLFADGDAGTEEEYVADYKKAVEILADDAAAAWLWSFPNLMVADVNVQGLPQNAVGESFVLANLSVS